MERQQAGPLPGRVPLAVVVVDAEGLVSHWSSGARRLFGIAREDAVGSAAIDLLPISGALLEPPARPDLPHGPAAGSRPPARTGPSGEEPPLGEADGLDDFDDFEDLDDFDDLDAPAEGGVPYPCAGWARLPDGYGSARDIMWWAYPLLGPGPEAMLVLAADASRLAVPGDRPQHAVLRLKETVAPGFALHTEFPGAEELARRLPEILPNMSPEQSRRIVSQVLDHGYPVLEASLHRRIPVTPDWGVPRRAVRDVQDAHDDPVRRALADRRAGEGHRELEDAAVRESLEFLNEVSHNLGASLDLASTIKEVTDASVPRFADFAALHVREQVLTGEGFPEGPPDVRSVIHRVWVAHNDEPGRWDEVAAPGEILTFPENTPYFRCMVTGQPVMIPRITEELAARIDSEFEKVDLRPLITGRSLLLVPLVTRGVVLGFLALLRRPERSPFDEVDCTTGAELAARSALVLDNARLYTNQECAADTLQDKMLPQRLPRLPGVDVATRYLPGAGLGRVGGDWFDTIELTGGRVALVVGDVMGHGLNSAAMMGQLRTAVQTMAALDMAPEELLRHLDDLAQRLGAHYLATCLYTVYDPVESRLTIANAGHIPPVLVRADGRTEQLDVPAGAPIGVGSVPFGTTVVQVGGGDRLVLCTDGLVEVRGQGIGEGLAALCESAAHPAASMDDACDTIIRTLDCGGQRRNDDVALLMARLNGIPRENIASWRLTLDPREARRARGLTRDTLRGWGLDDLSDTAELLVGEVVANAVRHARSGRVGLRLLRSESLLCEISDDDRAVPSLCPSGPEREGGRGLHVVSSLASRWGANRTATGKTVWFELPLKRAGA